MSISAGVETLKQLNRKSNRYSKRELIIFGLVIFLVYGTITFVCFYLQALSLASEPRPGALSPEGGALMMAIMLGGGSGLLSSVVLWRLNYNEGNASRKKHVINWIIASLIWLPLLLVIVIPHNNTDDYVALGGIFIIGMSLLWFVIMKRHMPGHLSKKTWRSEELLDLPSNMKKSKVVYDYNKLLEYIDVPKRGSEETWESYTTKLSNPVEIAIGRKKINYNYCHALLFSDTYSIKIKKKFNFPLILTYTSSVLHNIEQFIETEDIKLNDNLDIFCDDSETVFYVLTPQVIEAINDLLDITGKRVIFFFIDGWMHLFIPSSNILNHLKKWNLKNNYKIAEDIASGVLKIQKLIDA